MLAKDKSIEQQDKLTSNSKEKLGLYDDAIEAYKQAIRIDPDHVNAYYCLGFSYFEIGDKSSALNEYEILKKLDINLANELFDFIYK